MDLDRLGPELTTNREEFERGMAEGVADGIAGDLQDQVEGVVEMVQLSARAQQFAVDEAIALLTSETHRQRRQQQADALVDLYRGLEDFLDEIERNPRLLWLHGHELGDVVGRRLADEFNDRFMPLSTREKGHLAGYVAGVMLTEIAVEIAQDVVLGLLGPGGWEARGARAAQQGLRIADRLLDVTRAGRRFEQLFGELAERIPAVRRVLDSLQELRRIERRAGAVEPELGAGRAAPEEAAFDQSFAATFSPGPVGEQGPYQTTQRLARGNLGERLGTEALASMGHTVLMYKPSILGTNQGGIDMVTRYNGVLHLVECADLRCAREAEDQWHASSCRRSELSSGSDS